MTDKIEAAAKILWISLWAALATLILSVPMTVAALLSSNGNLALTISTFWARTMLVMTNVHPRIRNPGSTEGHPDAENKLWMWYVFWGQVTLLTLDPDTSPSLLPSFPFIQSRSR